MESPALPTWWVSFAVFLALTGAWSLSAPLFSAPDEPAHVIKAAGVVRGQLVGRASSVPSVGVMRVPTGIAAGNDVPNCYAFKRDVSAVCAPTVENTYSTTRAPTTASLYPPVYYLLVGWPSLIAPSALAIYLMRVVSAAICAAMIASAVSSARSFRQPRPMLLALGVATTPMVVFLASVVNPSAVEITSAICFWVSGALLLSEPDVPNRGRVIIRTAVAGGLLASMRWFSPVFVGIIALSLAASASRSTLVGLVRDRRARIWGALVVGSALLTAGWTLLVGGSQQSATQSHTTAIASIVRGVIGRQDFNFRQMIGFFGWLDTPAPSLTYHLWVVLLGFLVIAGFICARGRLKWVIAATGIVTVILPIAVETLYYPKHGYFWQGRYTLPLAVGVTILAGLAMSRENGTGRMLARGTGFVVAALSIAQGLAYLAFAQRFSVGKQGPLNFIAGSHWSPPIPFPVLVVVALGAGIAYYNWLIRVVLSSRPEDTQGGPMC